MPSGAAMSIVGQIFTQLGDGEKIRVENGAADPPRSFGKITQPQNLEPPLLLHVAEWRKVDDFAFFQTPRLRRVVIFGFLRVVITLQPPGLVLLDDHDRGQPLERRIEAADVPESAVFVVAEEVPADGLLVGVIGAGDFLEDIFFHRAGVGCSGVVQRGGECRQEKTEEE